MRQKPKVSLSATRESGRVMCEEKRRGEEMEGARGERHEAGAGMCCGAPSPPPAPPVRMRRSTSGIELWASSALLQADLSEPSSQDLPQDGAYAAATGASSASACHCGGARRQNLGAGPPCGEAVGSYSTSSMLPSIATSPLFLLIVLSSQLGASLLVLRNYAGFIAIKLSRRVHRLGDTCLY